MFLVVTALRLRDTAGADAPNRLRIPSRTAFLVAVAALVAVVAGVTLTGVLLGDSKLLLGDVANWVQGRAGRTVSFVLDARVPRVLAALCAGASLAVAGTLVQAVPATPRGARGTGRPRRSRAGRRPARDHRARRRVVGHRGCRVRRRRAGPSSRARRAGRLPAEPAVLAGIGTAAGSTALISLFIALTDPFSATKALTWPSGSTYGRTMMDVLPVALVLALGLVVAVARRTELDLVSLDEDTPRAGLPGRERPPRRDRRRLGRHHRLSGCRSRCSAWPP